MPRSYRHACDRDHRRGRRGRRLGAAVPKQLLDIGGRSMLERSVDAFAVASGDRRGRSSSLPPELVAEPRRLTSARPCRPLHVVAGGARRQDSVANAFDAREPDGRRRADPRRRAAVRQRRHLISRTIDAAAAHGAAIAALAVARHGEAGRARSGRRAHRRDDSARDDLPRADAAGIPPRRARARRSRSARPASRRPTKRRWPSAPATACTSSTATRRT